MGIKEQGGQNVSFNTRGLPPEHKSAELSMPHIVCVDEAHGDSSQTREGCMHRIVCQDLAVNSVVGGRGDGPDHVGGVL